MRFNFFCFLFLCLASHITARALFEEPWGRDSDLKVPSVSLEPKKNSLATRVADKIIKFHQEVLSPVDGPRSSFRPTSSRYMQLAMHRYGFIKGFLMGCDRLLRENDESWIYHTIEIDGKKFKFDPAVEDKYLPFTPK